MKLNTVDEITFQNGATRLAGTLLRPSAPGPYPAVVLVHGSGPEDRDSSGYFPPIREHFVRRGIAVLCYDKPGIGASSGDWRQQSFQDRAQEALAALRCLRDREGIDQHHVGLWGISQGGWIAPLAASMSTDVAFIIPVSAPGVSPAEQDEYDIEHNMRADGLPEEQVTQGVAYVRSLMIAARLKHPYEQVDAEVLQVARDEPWFGYFAIPDAQLWDFFLRGDPDYDPVPILERVRCPVLAIFGALDRQIPAHKSARVFQQALRRAGNPDVTIRMFPNADHGIADAGSQHFAPGYLELMSRWIMERSAS
jgi:dipeptidyl aminopeptidase/acylaminoacyl peptidase